MFKLNDIVKFNTISPVILGEGVQGKIISIEPFEKAALNSKKDLASLNTVIYKSISENDIPALSKMVFIELELSNGDRVYFADKWIDMSTYTVLENIPIVKFVFTNLLNDELEDIKAYLRLKGITDYIIEE